MRLVDKTSKLDRRRFLQASAGGAALFAAGPVLPPSAFAAVTLQTAPTASLPTLVRMARDLYPHDGLPDSAYQAAVVAIDAQCASDPTKKTALTDGAQLLDAAATRLKGHRYLAIQQEADRVAVLTSIEDTGFFKTMRSTMITALYNQQPLWARFGYEGSSAEKGGYLHRGFDDLDWLPA